MDPDIEMRHAKWEVACQAFIALGSNQGDSVQAIRLAIERLQAFSDQPLRKSSLYRTDPVDCPPGSPPFVNAVVMLEPRDDETSESLLAKLKAMEKDFGRQSAPTPNAPRPMDLDLIAFDAETRSSPELTLPHPRAHLRRFVLQPLSEIAPDFVLPGQTKSVAMLLKELKSDERVERLEKA